LAYALDTAYRGQCRTDSDAHAKGFGAIEKSSTGAKVMRTIIVCGIALLSLSSAMGGDAAKDQKSLQGKWLGIIKGRDNVELTFSGNKWSLISKEKDDHHFKGTFTLDPKAKPNAIDMKITAGGSEAGKFVGKTVLAIYELSGDTLRWAASDPGREDRPTEFSNEGKALFVEFKRAK